MRLIEIEVDQSLLETDKTLGNCLICNKVMSRVPIEFGEVSDDTQLRIFNLPGEICNYCVDVEDPDFKLQCYDTKSLILSLKTARATLEGFEDHKLLDNIDQDLKYLSLK